MGKLIQFLLVAWCCLPIMAQETPGWKMAVISDIHILAPELLQEDGAAFQKYVSHDRKMLKESPDLLKASVDALLEKHPDVVLVTGDLTKDGEKLSHEYVAQRLLKPLREAGIRVYVVPGNHDVNNPHAVVFLGDTAQRTATVSSDEFAQCYQDYGYGQAIARDEYSLSYVVQLNDSVRLLAIDACKYEENDFDRNICVTGGRIKPETMNFIRLQTADAAQQGCSMLAMMHHGLVRHWKWQDKVMADYLVDDWKKQAKAFGKLGLRLVFTGHFHAQDIAGFGKGNKAVYDIETGSTVSYPLPYRMIFFKGRQVQVTTDYIRKIPGFQSTEALDEYARQFAEVGINAIVRGMLPGKVPDTVALQAGEALSKAFIAHLAGDEKMPATYPAELKAACKALRSYSWKYAYALNKLGRYMYTDIFPEDNEWTIELDYAY